MTLPGAKPIYKTFVVKHGLFNATIRDFQMGREHPERPGYFADTFTAKDQGEFVQVVIRYWPK